MLVAQLESVPDPASGLPSALTSRQVPAVTSLFLLALTYKNPFLVLLFGAPFSLLDWTLPSLRMAGFKANKTFKVDSVEFCSLTQDLGSHWADGAEQRWHNARVS